MNNSRENILNMLKDVKSHQRDKKYLLAHYVQSRLDNSIQVYYKQLLASYSSLISYDEVNVLKKLSKNN